ncbi:transcriptional antitermination N peptide [Pantoea sp. A4]|uniref:transcriptional antitermination N peptide n=1 Tax=Pantoea sp. A4 TaxID=1225184 RepID=UPI000375E520|nr:hypothetical protein [Pantoea sp. A4]
MAIIHYGKTTFAGNARTRRHHRRKPVSRLKLSIDQALGIESPGILPRQAERICLRPVRSRVDRAVMMPAALSTEQASLDNCCLPHIYLYAAR